LAYFEAKGERQMPDAVQVMVGVTPGDDSSLGMVSDFWNRIAAVARSFAATVASMVFFGWLLVLASLIEFVDAFMVGHWAGFFSHVLLAILFGIVGLLMVVKPVISAEAATVLMSMFFLISGLYQLLASLWTHLPGWGWQALNGIIAAGMGVLILAQWPVSGLWVIGLFVGIDLIFFGWTWIALALNLRRMQ
jgi:uncharacterized membrane protein HdeD (DUF308 family)